MQSWQQQLRWRALFITLLCSNDYSASKLCILQEWWGLGLSLKICYNEWCCFHPSLANASEDVPKTVVFVMYVLQLKGDLFILLSPCQCCRNSVFLLRCSESSAQHWADDSFVFVSGGCLEINPSLFSSQGALSKPLLGGGEVVPRGSVGAEEAGSSGLSCSISAGYSCRLRFAKIKVLTDKTLTKFTAKIKASPTCSSLLTPVPGLPAPAQHWQDGASGSGSAARCAAAG